MKTKEEIQVEINKSETACQQRINSLSGDDQMYEGGYREGLKWVLEDEN